MSAMTPEIIFVYMFEMIQKNIRKELPCALCQQPLRDKPDSANFIDPIIEI